MDITSSPKWKELTSKISFIDKTNYQNTLALFYSEFGKIMLEDKTLQRFIATYQNKKIPLYYASVRGDLYQFELNIMVQEFRNKISVVDSKKSYWDVIKLLYSKMEPGTYDRNLIQKIIDIYKLDSKFHISFTDIQKDFTIIKLKEAIGTITDIESYKHTLELYYNMCENEAFDKAMVQKFIDIYQLDKKLHIGFSNVWNDLAKIKFDEEIGVITDEQSYLKRLELYYNEFDEKILFDEEIISKFISTYHLDTRLNISADDVWNDLARIKRQSELEIKLKKEIKNIKSIEAYKEALELYYNVFGDNMFEIEKIQKFISTFKLKKLDITPNIVYRDLRGIKQACENGSELSSNNSKLVKPNTHIIKTATTSKQPQDKQTQTISNTQTVQKQNKANTIPPKKKAIAEEKLETIDFYCFDVGELSDVIPQRRYEYCYTDGKLDDEKSGEIPQSYEEAERKNFAICYLLKGPTSSGLASYDVDYVYVGKKHIIETIPPKSESMGEYLYEYLGYSDEQIDQFIEEGQEGMTIVTAIESGEIKVYPQYNYIPKYTISCTPFNDSAVNDVSYDGNIEGILSCNIENVKSDNINRYKFLVLLKKLLDGKKVLETKKEDKADNLAILKQVAYYRTLTIQLNMFFCKEVFFISDDGILFLEDDLLVCFQYLSDNWNTSNLKSYKLYLTKACVNLATCLCLSDRSQDFDKAKEYDKAKENALENAVLAEHYNLLELEKSNSILNEHMVHGYLLPCHLLQKLVEDYLCFENGHTYNYERLGLGKGGYYGEYYGMASYYDKKDFSWTDGDNHYVSYVLGCQKAFINKNKIFLGEYTSSRYKALGIEIEIKNMSYTLTFRITPDANRTSKLISKMMARWTLRQKVDYGRYKHDDERDDENYNREEKENWEKTYRKWILQVQPQIHAGIEFEEETIILEETIRSNTITIGSLLDSIKATYKECEKLTEGALSIYSYFDEELESIEQEYDWREDYISPSDYYNSSDDWE